MDDLLPHQRGLIEKKLSIDLEIDALHAFIVSTETYPHLHSEEQRLLKLQLNAMRMVATFLDARIDLFPIIKHEPATRNHP